MKKIKIINILFFASVFSACSYSVGKCDEPFVSEIYKTVLKTKRSIEDKISYFTSSGFDYSSPCYSYIEGDYFYIQSKNSVFRYNSLNGEVLQSQGIKKNTVDISDKLTFSKGLSLDYVSKEIIKYSGLDVIFSSNDVLPAVEDIFLTKADDWKKDGCSYHHAVLLFSESKDAFDVDTAIIKYLKSLLKENEYEKWYEKTFEPNYNDFNLVLSIEEDKNEILPLIRIGSMYFDFEDECVLNLYFE